MQVEFVLRNREQCTPPPPSPSPSRLLPHTLSFDSSRPEVKTNSCNSLFSSETQTHTLLGRQLVLLIRVLPLSLPHYAAHPQVPLSLALSDFLSELNCQMLVG